MGLLTSSMATVANSTTLGNSEEMEGGQDGHTANITSTSEQPISCDTRVIEPVTVSHAFNHDNA